MRFWLNFPLRNQAGDGDGGGGGTPALDAAAISKLISDGVNAALNGYDKKLQTRLSKLAQPVAPPAGDDANDEGDDPPPTQRKPQAGVDPEVAKLRKQLENTNKRLADQDADRAREKETVKAEKLDAALRRELSKFTFVDDDAFEAGYAAIARGAKYADDGALVGGADDLPLSKYVEARMKKLDTLLQPKNIGGAGASNGGKPSAAGEIEIESIKPGMSADDIAKVRAKLADLYRRQ